MYRKIADQAKKLLTPDGKIFVEIGFQQGKSVQRILRKLFQIKSYGHSRFIWKRSVGRSTIIHSMWTTIFEKFF